MDETVLWDPHDPAKLAKLATDVRGLQAELSGLRDLMDERNKRYEQSFRESKDAVASALAAAKDQVAYSMVASQRLIALMGLVISIIAIAAAILMRR